MIEGQIILSFNMPIRHYSLDFQLCFSVMGISIGFFFTQTRSVSALKWNVVIMFSWERSKVGYLYETPNVERILSNSFQLWLPSMPCDSLRRHLELYATLHRENGDCLFYQIEWLGVSSHPRKFISIADGDIEAIITVRCP